MMNYTELEKKSSYELAEEMQCVLTKYFEACNEQDDVTNQAEYDKCTKVIDELLNDLSVVCMVTQRVIARENNTKEAKQREDLYAKYANKYFRYGREEVVFFNIGERRNLMSFDSMSCCGEPKLQVTSNCSFKKKEFNRTSYREIEGTNQYGKYICEYLEETTKEEFDAFLRKKNFQETIESL